MFSNLNQMDLVREMTVPMLLVSTYAGLGGISFGIDNNFWSGFLGMSQFKKDFGVWDDTSGEWIIPSTWQSIATGTPTAGMAVGCLISGFVGQRLGRIRSFLLAAVIAIVGILIQATSFHAFWQLMAGRIINSISMGIICNVVPTYQSECAPTKIRGSLINMYQFFLLVGGVLTQTANWGLESRTDQWAYRVILILQFIVPVVMIIGVFVLPESPRWLVGAGKNEEALKVLTLLRKGTPQDLVEQEVQLLMASDEQEKLHNHASSWLDCLRGTNLRRTAIATGVQCLQQGQGSSFMSNYTVTFLIAVGIPNVYEVTVLLYFVNMAASGFAFYFADKIGRRNMLMGAAVVMAICMFAVAAVTGYDNVESSHKGALSALFIWQFFQAVGWSSCVWIVTAEVPTLQLREKTITIATFSGFCVGVLSTFLEPFMQNPGYGNLAGRVGFVYGSFSWIAVVWVFFMVPEVKGRSLEELDELFGKGISTFKFSSYMTESYGAQLTVAEHIAARGEHGEKGPLVVEGLEIDPIVTEINVGAGQKEDEKMV